MISVPHFQQGHLLKACKLSSLATPLLWGNCHFVGIISVCNCVPDLKSIALSVSEIMTGAESFNMGLYLSLPLVLLVWVSL